MGCSASTAKVVAEQPPPLLPPPITRQDPDDFDFYLPLDSGSDDSADSNQLSSDSNGNNNNSGKYCVLSFADYIQMNQFPQILEYQFIESIGRGSHGEVYLCRNVETDTMYAAKVYSKLPSTRVGPGDNANLGERIGTEIQILNLVKDKHCIQLVDVLDDDYTQSIIIIMTLAKGGSLLPEDAITTPFSEDEAQIYFAQIAQGVNHLHSLNVVHRDIKPHNILRTSSEDQNSVVISDYSASAILNNETDLFTDTEGTPMFFSPEECTGDPYLPKPADVWALGVSLYIFVYGRPPFFEEDEAGIFLSHFYRISQLIQENDVFFDPAVKVSEELIDLLKHLLDKNPETRFTIRETLKHPWVKHGIEKNR